MIVESENEPTCSAPESIEKQKLMRKLTATRNSVRLPKLFLLVFLWVIFGWAFYSAWQAKINFKPYDPFEILGVSPGSSEDVIKNRFKRLSRIHHPDKAAPEDREKAEGMFVEISKAYKAYKTFSYCFLTTFM